MRQNIKEFQLCISYSLEIFMILTMSFSITINAGISLLCLDAPYVCLISSWSVTFWPEPLRLFLGQDIPHTLTFFRVLLVYCNVIICFYFCRDEIHCQCPFGSSYQNTLFDSQVC